MSGRGDRIGATEENRPSSESRPYREGNDNWHGAIASPDETPEPQGLSPASPGDATFSPPD
ncbi:hypothetical protein [Oxynema aestuarii]|uniref:Uncharacterized protein n=1 Tax=Oxynema aestuarii AP17 TaxID=2064643 RepID=A0A6H1U2W5_9CYAN|nr:hypothetical protein [Oxynema aestuarii]QIZ72995.1 hypothetical protein HCG48_22295 [Oxynema aestuarii AP17]